jgi:hypothetical protein
LEKFADESASALSKLETRLANETDTDVINTLKSIIVEQKKTHSYNVHSINIEKYVFDTLVSTADTLSFKLKRVEELSKSINVTY